MRPRWNEGRSKPRRSADEILAVRDQRRTKALAVCISDTVKAHGRGVVSHARIAEELGIPLPFLNWKYPTRESLLALGLTVNRDQNQNSSGALQS